MLLVLLGGSCMSFVGLCMRLIEAAEGFQILMYRSMSLCAMVALVCCLRRRVGFFHFLRGLDRHDILMGAALSIAFATYVFSMLFTSVASTLFIITIAPFMAAIIGWVWIGEKPHPVTWFAMIGAIGGVSLMIGDGIEMGHTLGNLLALLSALCFAVMLVLARRSGKQDVLGGTFLGGFFALLIGFVASLLTGAGIDVSPHDLGIMLFMGAFTIGIGIAFVTWGASYVPAAEVSLLVLIESVLGPIWPWLFLGETLSVMEIIGGATVMLAVIMMTMFTRKSIPVTSP
ncbi:MAG: DMT family transporter [Candidatus Puniceispirillum sp.]|nr:DMT family transporter [Candidatus Puniceispirillum sp.]MBT6415478.1 DMT family transporter [Candidatus Puniceispirillum sp.]MBT6566247.1 DMT family transporter [Candidatus Puniceispirillum sp.]